MDAKNVKVVRKVNETHLGYIQAVITRMGQNSFQIKGWCVTLVSALFAIFFNQANVRKAGLLAMLFVIVLSWALDAYYLYLERGYRNLYSKAVLSCVSDYDMAIPKEERTCCKYIAAFFSKSVLLFYGIVFVVLFIMLLVQCDLIRSCCCGS